MISTTQSESLAVLTELCDLSPDIRFGQLLAHLGFLGEDEFGRPLLDIDDEQFLSVLYRHRAELVTRSSTATPPLTGFGHEAPTTHDSTK